MKSGHDLINDAKTRIKEVTPEDVAAMRERNEDVVLLDCRDLPEVNLGRIPGAVHISRGNIETKIEAVIPREAQVVIYCATGNRSVLAADTLQQMGYKKVASMSRGIRGWMEIGGDVE